MTGYIVRRVLSMIPVALLVTVALFVMIRLTPGDPVTLSAQMPNGTSYRVRIAVDGGYLFTIQQSMTNASGQARTTTVPTIGSSQR